MGYSSEKLGEDPIEDSFLKYNKIIVKQYVTLYYNSYLERNKELFNREIW